MSGTHAGYILVAWGLTGLIVAALTLAVALDHRNLRRRLRRLGRDI